MKIDANIVGRILACQITADRPLKGAVLCLSCHAPHSVEGGGERLRVDGGYVEVTLPPLVAGSPHRVELLPEDDHYNPANRAWLPLGPYLRMPDGKTLTLELGYDLGQRPSRSAAPVAIETLPLVPAPEAWVPAEGTCPAQSFAVQSPDAQALDALSTRLGLTPVFANTGIPIRLITSTTTRGSYTLTVEPTQITLVAPDANGVRAGLITLLNLRETTGGELPCGQITDSPRFWYRGFHLDCARHFYEVPSILRLLDLMALFKLNHFHWHFADDEAFRVELESLPELAERTAFRGEAELIPGVFGGGPRAGGTYSQADVARVLEHAEHLGITVVPEIEAPAHALCITRTYPETRDPADTGREASVQGYLGNVMNPAMPRSWAVWEAMIKEVATVFPGPLLHLGCDEMPAQTWMGSPAARALMEREGLETTKDLQGWTMNRLGRMVQDAGKRPAAWEEAAQGKQGIEHDALLFSWTGQGPGFDAARAGYEVVMTPAQKVYLDMAPTADQDDWGANWAAFLPLSETVNWNPAPAELGTAANKIAGVQGCFWGEFTTTDTEMEPMIAPRILGVAAMAWRGTGEAPWLEAMADAYRHVFARIGWTSL